MLVFIVSFSGDIVPPAIPPPKKQTIADKTIPLMAFMAKCIVKKLYDTKEGKTQLTDGDIDDIAKDMQR